MQPHEWKELDRILDEEHSSTRADWVFFGLVAALLTMGLLLLMH